MRSDRFGLGRVELDAGTTAIVRFEHGLEECEKHELVPVRTLQQVLEADAWDCPLRVITRSLAEAIQSTNDQWGVFARSRIELLPHQLWVCRQVLKEWPARWLVADDVGLGTTVEAGLILWPLLARGLVKRLLIMCPASLVEQWQYRLRTMFDIRVAQYVAEADTRRADFWGTHHQVVASLQTLRSAHGGRHERLFEAPPWDLLIVDEAHHLNADEEAGPTHGYELVRRLVEQNLVTSLVFFTGTPHRGKDFGFLSLLRLLRQEFDPRLPMRRQLDLLGKVMIRNNKQNVTDLQGRRLFQTQVVRSETYSYSPAEDRFYRTLTEFIATGKAYASSLVGSNGRAVMLVLITMQKLASSSVAAIRRALRRRLARITEARQKLEALEAQRAAAGRAFLERHGEAEVSGDNDLISAIEEQVADLVAELPLMRNEEPRLQELVALADEVIEETKIRTIVDIIADRFADRPVLLFTEYKATQAVVMSALLQRFGAGCVTFINGDDAVEDVVLPSGARVKLQATRDEAAAAFNAGDVRFLVSTEAGGEGIDLQEACHSLIHVDLPWNPMRLHQRVGRLNRHGQRRQVEVVSLRNPSTVEALIWDKLNAKLDAIMLALSKVMEEPEDLLQLVLGMTSPSLFREIFADAPTVPPESLSRWFDERTGRLGGKDAVDAVRDLVGNCAKFDFQAVSDQLPQVDLPALRPFFLSMLVLNGRRAKEEDGRLSFRTPQVWIDEPGVSENYDGVTFTREAVRGQGTSQVIGVGHKVFDRAVQQAKISEACVASVRRPSLARPLVILSVQDRVTSEQRTVRGVVIGVEMDGVTSPRPEQCLRDWELIGRLNELTRARGMRTSTSAPTAPPSTVLAAIEAARAFVEIQIERLGVNFRQPKIETMVVLWPNTASEDGLMEHGDGGEEAGSEEEDRM